MPVASLRSNQVASNDNMDSAKALIGMIDKKVRNLEKRKVCIFCFNQHPDFCIVTCSLSTLLLCIYLPLSAFNSIIFTRGKYYL